MMSLNWVRSCSPNSPFNDDVIDPPPLSLSLACTGRDFRFSLVTILTSTSAYSQSTLSQRNSPFPGITFHLVDVGSLEQLTEKANKLFPFCSFRFAQCLPRTVVHLFQSHISSTAFRICSRLCVPGRGPEAGSLTMARILSDVSLTFRGYPCPHRNRSRTQPQGKKRYPNPPFRLISFSSSSTFTFSLFLYSTLPNTYFESNCSKSTEEVSLIFPPGIILSDAPA